MNRGLTQLKRRLERAELVLLRQAAADQAARIEAMEAELAEAHRAADWADGRAEMFQALAHDLAEQADTQIGLTCAGGIGAVPSHVAH